MTRLLYFAVAPLLALVLLPVYAEISITRPLLILADEEGNPLDLPRSASEVEAMEKASLLPDGTYRLIRPDAKIVVEQGVNPLPPVEPPTDPNQPTDPVDPPPIDPPVEPPTDPNDPVADWTGPNGEKCGRLLGGPECPRGSNNFTPTFPPLGQYSVAGICQSIHPETVAQVTMKNGELFEDAYKRLFAIADHDEGGILNVPHSVRIANCDRLYIVGKEYMEGGLTVRGIKGPNGEMPRMYCRHTGMDGGTVPTTADTGVAWSSTYKSTAPYFGTTWYTFLMENFEVDGYAPWVSMWAKKVVLRNNWFHHTRENGIHMPRNKDNYDFATDMTLEVCGNHISHGGQGNTRHNFYLHRNEETGGTGPDRVVAVAEEENTGPTYQPIYKNIAWIVDNVIHNSGGSAIKSTAQENHIIGNTIYADFPTDPQWKPKPTTMLIDLISCAQNEIKNNDLHDNDPEARGWGDSTINFRLRKGEVVGCDAPMAYTRAMWDHSASQEQDKMTGSPFWADAYWDDLIAQGRPKLFKSVVEGNTIRNIGAGAIKHRAIRTWGTYPVNVTRSFSPACWYESHPKWYERMHVYSDKNTYIGFAFDKIVMDSVEAPGNGIDDWRACTDPLPSTADLYEKSAAEGRVTLGENDIFLE